MAKPEQCSHCKKTATIHLTQIIDSKIHKVDLCDECPFKQGVTDAEGFSLADFLLKPPAIGSSEEELTECPSCGFTPLDFKKSGRFGCPDCYETYRGMLSPMLANMHKDVVHEGKVPETVIALVDFSRRQRSLEQELQEAIQSEQFEEAARIRDELAALRAEAPETEES